MVARLVRDQEARGSNPRTPTKNTGPPFGGPVFLMCGDLNHPRSRRGRLHVPVLRLVHSFIPSPKGTGCKQIPRTAGIPPSPHPGLHFFILCGDLNQHCSRRGRLHVPVLRLVHSFIPSPEGTGCKQIPRTAGIPPSPHPGLLFYTLCGDLNQHRIKKPPVRFLRIGGFLFISARTGRPARSRCP